MTKRKKERIAQVEVYAFTKSGNGIGKTVFEDGSDRLVEVPFAIPGDSVQAKLLRKKSGVFESRLEEIVTPSTDRITPKCIHFGVCGGCKLQQISYQKQLQNKEEIIRHCLESFYTEDTTVYPIAACDPPWNYRNKMEYTFHSNLAKDQFLGLIISASRGKVINLTECHLTNPWFVETLKEVREWWKNSGVESYHPPADRGTLRTLTLREGMCTGDRMVMLTVSGKPEDAMHQEKIHSFVEAVKKAAQPTQEGAQLSIFLRIQQAIKGSATQFYEIQLFGPDQIREVFSIDTGMEHPLQLTFGISPQAFFQPNTQQAERLYSLALTLAKIPKDGVVYDLYCGTGTLGICAAKYARQVIGIELSPESSLDARTNAKENGLDNITIYTGDAGKTLALLAEKNEIPKPDLVMVDPPRAGLDPQALNHVIQLNAPTILYISCNPYTQAANIKELVLQGYAVTAVQPVDQFPQTMHLENIVILKKK